MTLTTATPWERRITTAWRIYDLVDEFRLQRDPSVVRPLPFGRVRFRIIATVDGGNREELAPPLDLVMQRNASGHHLWFGTVLLPDGGVRGLPEGGPAIVVEIASEYYRRVEDVFVASAAAGAASRIDLAPGYAYPVGRVTPGPGNRMRTVLSGSLDEPDGTGEAGATIDVSPQPVGQPAPNPAYTTDGAGRWLLIFDDAVASTANARIRVSRPDQPTVFVDEVAIVEGETRSLRQASLAGRVVRVTGTPVAGARLSVNAFPEGSATSGADGRFELVMPIERFRPSDGPRAAVLTAEAPSGATQQRPIQIRPRATVDVAEFVFP